MMTAMDFCPSDLDQVSSNFLEMIENDINGQLLEMDGLHPDKLGDFMCNGEQIPDNLSSQMELDQDSDLNNLNFLQNIQWNSNDMSKIPQSLIDASSEIENNNPNLLVNPQCVLPVLSTHQVTTQPVNQINVRSGLPVKINGQDAILTPTQHPQIQYVTVQNVGTDSLNNTQIGYTVQPVTLCPQVQTVRTAVAYSPSQNSPVLVEHLQNGNNNQQMVKVSQPKPHAKMEKVFPKPVYSYSCLIAMALKNSKHGNLPVSEIYDFMIENFPYFKTAPDGWKNSVRHNLSLNKCFAKVESAKTTGSHTRKGCLWALNPAKIEKMEDEIVKWRKKDPESVKNSMAKPENLELIEAGKAGLLKEASSTPIKQEVMTQMTPRKETSHSAQTPVKIVLPMKEAAVMVKTEPELTLTSFKDMEHLDSRLRLDPALSDLALQNGLWDDELSSELSVGVSNSLPQTTVCGTPLSTSAIGVGTQYHGNITYSTSPLVTRSPLSNTTPTKLYPQTPTKLYPQTPTRIAIA